jgi:Domain of unknown function (DUF397)
MHANNPRTQWKKSSYSGNTGDCVEVAGTLEGVAVRDSKDRGGPELEFSPENWRGFLADIKAGRPG